MHSGTATGPYVAWRTTVNLDYLVVKGTPIDLIIRLPSLERLL